MHRAGAAGGNAATELGAGQPQFLAQRPEQRGIGLSGQFNGLAIDCGGDGHKYTSEHLVGFHDTMKFQVRKLPECVKLGKEDAGEPIWSAQ
jgi:hypothetical protein